MLKIKYVFITLAFGVAAQQSIYSCSAADFFTGHCSFEKKSDHWFSGVGHKIVHWGTGTYHTLKRVGTTVGTVFGIEQQDTNTACDNFSGIGQTLCKMGGSTLPGTAAGLKEAIQKDKTIVAQIKREKNAMHKTDDQICNLCNHDQAVRKWCQSSKSGDVWSKFKCH